MEEVKKQKIIRAIKEKEASLKEIAKHLFITEYQLKLLLGKWGVDIPRKRRYNKMPIPDRKNLMQLYAKYGNTLKVAQYFGVGINSVARWMRILNIPTRKLGKMTIEEKTDYLEKHLEKLENINL